jgi:hypothetical protein
MVTLEHIVANAFAIALLPTSRKTGKEQKEKGS